MYFFFLFLLACEERFVVACETVESESSVGAEVSYWNPKSKRGALNSVLFERERYLIPMFLKCVYICICTYVYLYIFKFIHS